MHFQKIILMSVHKLEDIWFKNRTDDKVMLILIIIILRIRQVIIQQIRLIVT